MRIGLLTTSYPRFPGDWAGGFVAEHAAFLARAGHDVEVIAGGTERAMAAPDTAAAPNGSSSGDALHVAPATPGAVRVHRLASGAALFDRSGAPEELARGGRAWLSAARFSLALTRAVADRARRWDAIVAHWLVPGGLAAIAAAPRLPLLAIAHSGDVHLLGRLRALRAMGRLCDRADLRLSFVSEELRRLFLARAPRCEPLSQVCPMGIDLARLQAVRRQTRDSSASTVAPTVLFLGRLVPVKGVDHLVRAALRWRSDARLIIAGSGPDEAALRALCAAAPPGRVTFAGELRGPDRDRALAAADIVVLPSVRVEGGRSEGLPLVALEAMAAGAALVASSIGGLADLPRDAVTHVPPGDAAALARAIDGLLEEPARRAAQVEVQDRLVPRYDWSSVGPLLVPPVRSRSVDRRRSVRMRSAQPA